MPPQNDELEVSVFSRGGGEAIAIHVGGARWILVDSLTSDAGTPASGEYLDSLGVPQDQVVAILLTHWHDDHIQGASQLVRKYSSARISTPATLKHDEFQGFLASAHPITVGRFSSGVSELINVFRTVQSQGKHVRAGSIDRRITGSAADGFEFWALSPSDGAQDRFLHALPTWLQTIAKGGKMPRPERNDTSVASLVIVGDDYLLLGADLEVSASGDGWHDVHRQAWGGRPKASFFKIPHHGSQNAHLEEVWSDLVVPNVHAALTPWNRNKKLPTKDDIERILKLTSNAFTASKPQRRAALKRDSIVEGITRDFGIDIGRAPTDIGHLRFRKKMNSASGWIVECLGIGSGPLIDMLSPAVRKDLGII